MFDNSALLRIARQVNAQAPMTPFDFVPDVSHFVENEVMVIVDFCKNKRWYDNEQAAWMWLKVGIEPDPKLDMIDFDHLFTLPSGTAVYVKIGHNGNYVLAATWLNDDNSRSMKIMDIDRDREPDLQYLGLILLANEWVDDNVDILPYDTAN